MSGRAVRLPDAEFWNRYPPPLRPIGQPIEIASGLSGGAVWKVSTSAGDIACRRWPDGTSRERIAALHRLLRFSAERGFRVAPTPIDSAQGSVVEYCGHLWECLTWQPGLPATFPASVKSAPRAAAAFAHWHSRFRPSDFDGDLGVLVEAPELLAWKSGVPTVAPAARRRSAEYRRLQDAIAQPAILTFDPDRLSERTRRGVIAASTQIAAWIADAEEPTPLCFCLRDARREHLLFDDSGAVSGLVDFGAVGVDSPVVDLARWLGDSAPPATWRLAFDEYAYRLPLPPNAHEQAIALHGLGTVVAALRWYGWLGLATKKFAHAEAAYARWREIVIRTEALADIR